MSPTPIDPVGKGSSPEPVVPQVGAKAPETGSAVRGRASGEARAQQLASLRRQIAEGTYIVDVGQLAADLIRSGALK